MKRVLTGAVFAAALALGSVAHSAETVKIGVALPLSGNAAVVGQAALAAVRLATKLINEQHPELAPMPLMATAGLPNLGGAQIELIEIDTQGSPSVGQNQVLRLITRDRVVAILGAYHSSVSMTTSAVAERHGVPFVCGESVAANLTERGFKRFFRTTPIASDFAKDYIAFFDDLNKDGHTIKTVSIVHENTDYGTSVHDVLKQAIEAHGYRDVADISYTANTTDVSAQVLQLKQVNPDAIVFASYTPDAILYVKTMKSLDYRPKLIIGDDAGFTDPSFIPTVGKDAQGAFSRSVWKLGPKGSPTDRVNEMYKALTGRDLDETSARDMQAMLVLAEAINRAGSTDPEKIAAALRATNLAASDLFVGYRGVKFDGHGQNILADTYLTQLLGERYYTIWPKAAAERSIWWPGERQ